MKAFEAPTKKFVEGLYGHDAFLKGLELFVVRLLTPGRVNSLAAMLLRLTSPGVPDTYQGTEIWDLSLVDPDNRLPVDYDKRRELLSEMKGLKAADVMKRMDEGR